MNRRKCKSCTIGAIFLFQQPFLDGSGDASIVSLSSSWHSKFFILSFLRGYGWFRCCDAGGCVGFVAAVVAVWSWLSRHLAMRSGKDALRACNLGRAMVGGERKGARCTASELS